MIPLRVILATVRLESLMGLFIPDDILKEAGLTDRDALIEFACGLFDSGKLELPTAVRLSGLSRPEFENQLASRGIAAYRPTIGDLNQDLQTVEYLRRVRPGAPS